MSTEWAKQQEQLKAAGALCAVTEERKKAIQEQHNAALEEIRQARNKTKVRLRRSLVRAAHPAQLTYGRTAARRRPDRSSGNTMRECRSSAGHVALRWYGATDGRCSHRAAHARGH